MRIIVTTGSSGAFLLSFLSAFDQGDRVGLALPGYPAYKNILAALDIEAVEIPDSRKLLQLTLSLGENLRLDGQNVFRGHLCLPKLPVPHRAWIMRRHLIY